MNKMKVLVYIMAAAGSLLPATMSAGSVAQTYVESYKGRTDGPVPLEVVAPEVSSRFAGNVVELTFVVDKDGKPSDLKSSSYTDPALEYSVMQAVSKWRFTPAMHEGKPVASKVKLPVHITAEE